MATPGPARRLSVIIPTLNEQAQIGGLLQDLAGLRRAGHEVIVVDGGSTDATLEVAATRADRVIRSDPGRAVQMNAGAALAKGEVLWFLHADMRVPADAARRLLDDHGAGYVWGRFDVRLSGNRWPLRVIAALMNLRSRISGICTGDQGIFVVRHCFAQAGGFPAIALMEDIALSRELRRLARPLCIRQPRLQTSSRRWERDGILCTVFLMWRLRLAYAFGTPPAELARRYR